jgi:thioredoxin reductase
MTEPGDEPVPTATRRVNVAVIGAGPAGLALGRALQARKVEFVILEKGRVAESWRRMPKHLKLVSPWKANWLTRDSTARFAPHAQLTRAEFVDYLGDFASEAGLPVITHCEVFAVERNDDAFHIHTRRGDFVADVVVNAAGYFSNPRVPSIPGAETTRLRQVHYADPRADPRSSSAGLALIVGHRLSAGQTALDLFDAGARVAISHRAPIRFGVGDWLWPIVYRTFPMVESIRLKLFGRGRKLDVPMPGGRVKKLIRCGAIQTFPAIERFERDHVVFTNGAILKPDVVIYATGFAPHLNFLTPLNLDIDSDTDLPVTREMESVSVSNLFFLGFEMLRNFQSRFLRGIRNDAIMLADRIVARLPRKHHDSEGPLVSERHSTPTPSSLVSRLSTIRHIARRALYYARIPITWTALTVHNTWGILNVLDIIWLRPMRGGLIDEQHPFCTGIDPATGDHIWHRNVVFASPRREHWPNPALAPDPDDEILRKVGDHLRKQVLMGAQTSTHPGGHAAPMPPGILYIHGGVHYNGVWLLFNDFPDAIRHFSDPKFAAEFHRLVHEERREPVTLFRDRDYDRIEFARFVCFMRTVFPWFSNCNGPKKFVLWGNPSPYPAVNTITGNWIRETRALKTEEGRARVARPPVTAKYFQHGPYCGERETTRWPENLLALLTDRRIKLRGERENLYFVDKRKIRRGLRFGPEPIPTPWQRAFRWLKRKAHEKPVNQTPL